MTSDPNNSNTVLIGSADATAAALLGALVETMGFTVQFARCDDSPDDRLRRVRPRIYMIDCATTDDCSDEVIARAIMRGVAVVLYGPREVLRGLRDLTTRHDIELLFTPLDPGPLGDVLDRAARRSG